MRNKIITVSIIFALIIITQTACGSKTDVEDTDFYLDTKCTISLYNIEEKEGEELISNAFQICDTYEKMLSKTIRGSDVDKINSAKGQFVEVTDETIDVIKEGVKMGEISGGAFDITIGRLTDIWDFKAKNPKVPSKKAIKAAVKTVDYKQIEIEGNKVRLKDKEAKIDLGGIAKGFIADKVTQMLRDQGVQQAIINLGGNVVAIGEKEKDTPWNIGVERPYTDRSEIVGTVLAADKVVVTSGIYERFFTVNGKQYHHIINPKTGYPVKSDMEAVTITGDLGTSMQCDGYSTICLLLGTKKGGDIIEQDDTKEALFLDAEGRILQTQGMEFVH